MHLFSKIFEKVFYNRLTSFLGINHLLTSWQYGFRKRNPNTAAIYEALNFVLSALDNKLESSAVFFDFSKAFDLVIHELILHKLDRYCIGGRPKNWINSCLFNRSQCVTIVHNRTKYVSPFATVSRGVHQEWILGPLLFLLYINDLPQILHIGTHSNPILYTDVTKVDLSAPSTVDIVEGCNILYKNLSDWCVNDFLVPNAGKSQLIYFENRNKTQQNLLVHVHGILFLRLIIRNS